MDNTMIAAMLWIGAAVVLGLYLMRRKGRKTKQFR